MPSFHPPSRPKNASKGNVVQQSFILPPLVRLRIRSTIQVIERFVFRVSFFVEPKVCLSVYLPYLAEPGRNGNEGCLWSLEEE
jgi:hypothetical protein